MDEWLSRSADALSARSSIERPRLDLGDDDVDTLFDLARIAAHANRQRTSAPLLCYLGGLARGSGRTLDELADAVRPSTS